MAEAWGCIGVTTIKKGLKLIGFSKKQTYGYVNRDEAKRKDFQ